MIRSLVAVVVAGVAVTFAAPATAADAVATAAPVACVKAAHGAVPTPRRFEDTTPVTQADLDAVPAVSSPGAAPNLALARVVAGSQLPRRVTIPVYVHVIKGTRRGERTTSGPKRVRRIISILNGGFHGRQLAGAPSSRYTFKLVHIDYTTREGWYHAYLFGPRDKRMKRALHRGGKSALNLYISGGGPSAGQPVLGWSRFPWQQKRTPLLDSVSVNVAAMPGGRLKHYNLGDTVIHETGHWMGLLHTFQGGCTPPGDLVADTPYEAVPSYACNVHRNTCPQPGTDPVHNFMDYSYDSCMNHFTLGQIARMDRAFLKYRR